MASTESAFRPTRAAAPGGAWRRATAMVAGTFVIAGGWASALQPLAGGPLVTLGLGALAAGVMCPAKLSASRAGRAAYGLQAGALALGMAASITTSAAGLGTVGLSLAAVAALAGAGAFLALAYDERRRGPGDACLAAAQRLVGMTPPPIAQTRPPHVAESAH